ncbi:MAG: 3-beta hydroxysteroid dehydrogenase [Caulobacter sp. 32-67-35]|nr:MAG: 3-beta hydroxysteroid dehydrogenase [Caulobacter sp. 32-67-35]
MAQNTGRVAGKKAFITGGAQGLGAAAGRMLASQGAKVSLADINLAGAQAVADEINAAHGAGTAFAFELDVTQEDEWIAVLEKATAAMGGLSVLVNNAGIGGDGGLIANGNSPAYNASKAAVWLLSKNIALYCAKMKLDIRSNSIHPTFIDTPILDGFTARFGKEEAHAKLARQVPLGRIGEPNDIANAVLYLASDESKFMTGAEIKVDGGISAM